MVVYQHFHLLTFYDAGFASQFLRRDGRNSSLSEGRKELIKSVGHVRIERLAFRPRSVTVEGNVSVFFSVKFFLVTKCKIGNNALKSNKK